MQDNTTSNNEFLERIRGIIRENLPDEKFGVSELASKAGMSRSNLLRKIKSMTGLSASQFINQERLGSAMELIKTGSYNVSEVAYEVGFNSTSYFIKCFREQYGYPPGEVGKRTETEPVAHTKSKAKRRLLLQILLPILSVIIIIAALFFTGTLKQGQDSRQNSIAVLPFKNDSRDSSNVYLVNGLMEALLNDLQQIEDLRVVSRTSVEKYRMLDKTVPEIARELGVHYVVEGSGQRIGEEILLNIQLIDAQRDRHLWSEQYRNEAKDIFDLQRDVANNIANEIKVIITPDEQERIYKKPTHNLIAYDYFLKGYDLFNKGTVEGLWEAIPYFEKAVEFDNDYARAIADISISYSLLDFYQSEKKYIDSSTFYANLAISIDSRIPQSLIAKALIYMNTGDGKKAIPYLEKALKYNPNSAMIINILSDFYGNHFPDTEKYLEYALKGISLDIASHDSAEASLIFLHVSNAFVQSGFRSEAALYIDKAIAYDPNNYFARYVKPYITFSSNGNLEDLNASLVQVAEEDLTRYDVLQEVGKSYYYLGDFENAYLYYRKFLDIKEAMNMDIYRFEDAKIAVVMKEMGYQDAADSLFDGYKRSAEYDRSIYKHLSLAMYYSYQGEKDLALQHLETFSQNDDFHYWILLFLDIDPLTASIRELDKYKEVFQTMEDNFWGRHDRMKEALLKKGLINTK